MSEVTTQPHDNWARYYDFIYETTYGAIYNGLTNNTLNVIQSLLPPGRIIDFGAGTGRLSIPLAQKGYSVIAVEKSSAMADIIREKAKAANLDIAVYTNTIQEFQQQAEADLAFCLFTVLSYTTTHDMMVAAIDSIHRSLKPGGYFFFDLPDGVFFNMRNIMNIARPTLNRSVTLEPTEVEQTYQYLEKCSGNMNGEQFNFSDNFAIKYWPMAEIDSLLQTKGFSEVKANLSQFNGTGSTYKLYQKLQ
jgi:SAM-dependent methyltransferase